MREGDPLAPEIGSRFREPDDKAQIGLVALMWPGRGDGDCTQLRVMARQRNDLGTESYVLGTPTPADGPFAGAAGSVTVTRAGTGKFLTN